MDVDLKKSLEKGQKLMRSQTLTLELPEIVYEQLSQMAQASQQSLDTVAIQSVRVGLPPNLNNFPEDLQSDLWALNTLADSTLWEIARSELDEDKTVLYEDLLIRNQNASLNKEEKETLIILRKEADMLMFRRSYAYALLKWRGNRVPTLADLQG